MNDDYLWDGSGEPDQDIEQLENLLGRYRSTQPAPQMKPLVVIPVARPRWIMPFAAVAAAVILAVGSIYVWQQSGQGPGVADLQNKLNVPVEKPTAGPRKGADGNNPVVAPPKINKSTPKLPQRRDLVPRDQQATNAQPATGIRPLMDVATALHLEQAEYLLRSFRNARSEDEGSLAELALDSRQSRDLLNQNVLLRRNAELHGNLSAEQILGDLEPFLVDIANLESRPSADDVASIQDRIQKKEIVADLQLYSSNRTGSGY